LFRPSIVKISLDTQDVERRRKAAVVREVAEPVGQRAALSPRPEEVSGTSF
jgi:hypothetical protein